MHSSSPTFSSLGTIILSVLLQATEVWCVKFMMMCSSKLYSSVVRNSVDRLVNSFFYSPLQQLLDLLSRYEPAPLTPDPPATNAFKHRDLPSLRFLLGANKMQFFKIKDIYFRILFHSYGKINAIRVYISWPWWLKFMPLFI